MSRIRIQNLEISYFDNGAPSNKTLVFIHGNSHTHNTFRHQLSDASLNHYRLVSLSLPGHGRSDRAAAYSVPFFASILIDFLDHLSLEEVVLVGHSLGGHVILNALENYTPSGIFLFGTPPLSRPLNMAAFKVHENLQYLLQNDLNDEQINSLINSFYKDPQIHPDDFNDMKTTDPKFRGSLAESFQRQDFKDEIILINGFDGPKAILHGLFDNFINADYLVQNIDMKDLWQNRIITLDAGHNLHIEKFRDFNFELQVFVDYIFNQRRELPFKSMEDDSISPN